MHPMPIPPTAVVFDMDGLLLDSERMALEAFTQACRDVSASVDEDTYARCIGSSWEATGRILSEALGSEARYQALRRRWDELYQARITESAVPLKPGARELLAALAHYGVPHALATSTARPVATVKLERAGVITSFSCLICGGETDRGKPHPDPYLAAVTALGTPPASSWALEDSENGVRAAHAAGLTVIQVPDLVPPSETLLALGHRVAADLFEVLDELHRSFTA
jgi:HAD superfamily hydrolase (TIGR01509 family)